jgi:hypothetical protein
MIERLKEALDGVSFHRGLALGALVGAAIAGSSLWAKVRATRVEQEGSSPPAAGDTRAEVRARS